MKVSPASAERHVAELLAATDVAWSYDDLARVATVWIEHAGGELPKFQSAGQSLRRLTRFFARRRFAEFRAFFKPRTSLEAALLELFLQTRIRTYVLAYLSVQEGEDFEGAASYETRAPILIAQLLRRLGRWSNATFSPGLGPLRLRMSIDPLVHLRKAYGLMLLRRPSRRALAYHRWMFTLKSRLVTLVLRRSLRRLSGPDISAGLMSILQNRVVRRLLATAIFILFPDAVRLTERDWLDLLDRISGYFAPRIEELLAAMPEQSIRDHGLIKLVKVAFGTIAGRTSVREVHEKEPVDFIFNTLRLAYSWGVTYPLVDNVLDSLATVPQVRAQLVRSLSGLFSGIAAEEQPIDHRSVREVHARLAEVISLVPPDRLPAARRTLGLLLESHQRDSRRRLSALPDGEDVRSEVMVDTALKAALVRLATMDVCGIAVDAETVARALVRSLFNQLGDDLWDIYEDADDDRVTPYTLFLTRGGGQNPFDFYLGYTALLAQGLSQRRQTAAFLGFCETLRDSLLALQGRKADSLGVTEAIKESLHRVAGVEPGDLVEDVPHVDFDAVLFALEEALFDVVGQQPTPK